MTQIKKYFLSITMMAVLISLSACGAKMLAEEAGNMLAETVCNKQESCLANAAFAKNICVEGLGQAYPQALILNGYKKVNIEEFNKCVNAVRATPCDKYSMGILPAECPFIRGLTKK